MITCIIDGLAAYPTASQSIKITYANQYVTDDGEYSYDISFPMEIMANRRVFHNVSRFDVSKQTQQYDDCKLYVGSRLVLSGVGTIISVSDTEIKLQIVGGKSRVKYNDKMTTHYIDEIDLGTATAPGEAISKEEPLTWAVLGVVTDAFRLDTDQTKFLGEKGKWCFVPVRDETNDKISNFVGVDRTSYYKDYREPYIMNTAVMPSLMYIFKKIIEYEGYTLVRNDLDVTPWNLLYIASAYKTRDLRRALPHWSVYTFIEEFRKFFNATIYFDDIKKTCTVMASSELSNTDCASIEPLDEYSTDYDSDGSFNTSSTANLEYNLGDAANRDSYEVISQKVFSNFELVSTDEMTVSKGKPAFPIATDWTKKQKRTTIVRFQGTNYIYAEDEDGNEAWEVAGIWSPLIRDSSSDDYTDLNISPAAQVVEEVNFKSSWQYERSQKEKRYLLSIPNDKESEASETDVDDDGYNYVSVQDALDDDSTLDDSEDDEECMNVFFYVEGKVQKYVSPKDMTVSWVGEKSRWPHFMTDSRINSIYRMELPDSDGLPISVFYSLCLNKEQSGMDTSIATLHDSGIKIDNKNCLEVKFKASDIPDPSDTYIIHHKKFACEKIEMEIKNDEIEPIYTGYFYMMS